MRTTEAARVQVVRTPEQEFVAFVEGSSAYLHRTAYLLCGDAHRAEELVQATYEKVYRAWSRAREGEPRAYARRILINLRIDGWRRERRVALPGDDALPLGTEPDPADGVALRDELTRALQALPLVQRRVIVLRHLLGLSEAEAAAELRLPLGTVKSANSRGLAHLRDALGRSALDRAPVPEVDAGDVLARSRDALRSRRRRQAAGAVAGALALVLALGLAGPIEVPGVGRVVLPGSEQLRRLVGLDDGEARGLGDLDLRPLDLAADPCAGADPVRPEPTATVPADDTPTGSFTVTRVFDAAAARAAVACVDVAPLGPAPAVAGADAGTSGADGLTIAVGRRAGGAAQPAIDGVLFTPGRAAGTGSSAQGPGSDPAAGRAGVPTAGTTRLATTDPIDGRRTRVADVARLGDRVAWLEAPGPDGPGFPWRLRVLEPDGSLVEANHAERDPAKAALGVALSPAVVGTLAGAVPASACEGTLDLTDIASMSAEPIVIHRAAFTRVCAIAGGDQGLLIASRRGASGPTRVERVSSVGGDVRPLLAIDTDAPVLAVAGDGRRTVFAVEGWVVVVPSAGEATAVRTLGPVADLRLAGDDVVWADGGQAYLLRLAADRPTAVVPALVRLTDDGGVSSVGGADGLVMWASRDGRGPTLTYARTSW